MRSLGVRFAGKILTPNEAAEKTEGNKTRLREAITKGLLHEARAVIHRSLDLFLIILKEVSTELCYKTKCEDFHKVQQC